MVIYHVKQQNITLNKSKNATLSLFPPQKNWMTRDCNPPKPNMMRSVLSRKQTSWGGRTEILPDLRPHKRGSPKNPKGMSGLGCQVDTCFGIRFHTSSAMVFKVLFFFSLNKIAMVFTREETIFAHQVWISNPSK